MFGSPSASGGCGWARQMASNNLNKRAQIEIAHHFYEGLTL
jgi:hypothetical protein